MRMNDISFAIFLIILFRFLSIWSYLLYIYIPYTDKLSYLGFLERQTATDLCIYFYFNKNKCSLSRNSYVRQLFIKNWSIICKYVSEDFSSENVLPSEVTRPLFHKYLTWWNASLDCCLDWSEKSVHYLYVVASKWNIRCNTAEIADISSRQNFFWCVIFF